MTPTDGDGAMTRYTLEQLAAAKWIDGGVPDGLREELATVQPDTLVSDESETIPFRDLYRQHLESGCEGDPWRWAFMDLVFSGYRVVSADAAKP